MKTSGLILSLLLFSGTAYSVNDSLVVSVHGDTVFVHHVNAHSLCNTKFIFTVSTINDTVSIVEQDTSRGHFACRCGLSDLFINITGLPAGKYVIRAFRHEQKVYGYPADTIYFMSSTTLRYAGSGVGTVSFQGYQLGCGNAVVSARQRTVLPADEMLLDAYPNPFNSSTVISFSIPPSVAQANVELAIYDVQGRIVKHLLSERLPAGKFRRLWDGSSDGGNTVASGVYFYHLVVGDQLLVRKLSFVK